MFSNRVDFDLAQNDLTRCFKQKQAAGDRLFDLTVSNPTRVGIEYPGEAILTAMHDPEALVYRPIPSGLPTARAAVSCYYRGRGVEVDPNKILLTASTSEAYAYLFKLFGNPGDSILTPRPSYPLFDFLCTLECVRPEFYQLHYSGSWHIDLSQVKTGLEGGARAILLVNPNNPTGSFIRTAEWEALQDLALEFDVPVILDEVFFDFPFCSPSERLDPLSSPRTPLIALNGLSKIAGLPQMKLGWMILAGPESFRREAMERLEVVADTFLSVSAPVQHGLARLIELAAETRSHILERVRSNYSCLTATLRASSARCLEVEGGWYAILRLPKIRTEEEWAHLLLDRSGVYLHPGYFFGFEEEPYAVVSLLPDRETFAEGIRRLAEEMP